MNGLLSEAQWPTYASLNWVIIGLGNGLAPIRHQAIAWTSANLLPNKLLGRNLTKINQNLNIFIDENALQYVVCEMVSILSLPQCVLRQVVISQ